jgi:TonB family protein
MIPRLFSGFKKKKEEVISLNIGSVSGPPAGPPPVVHKAYVPDHRFIIGKEPDAYASVQVTERQADGRMVAAVVASYPFLKGTWKAELLTGELRLFALGIDAVRRGGSGSARVTLVPHVLRLIVYFDQKQQAVCFAVDYCGPLGVHQLCVTPLAAADMVAVIDSLQAADPGELTKERVAQIREREAARSTPPPAGPPTYQTSSVTPVRPPAPPGEAVLKVGEEPVTAGAVGGTLAQDDPATSARDALKHSSLGRQCFLQQKYAEAVVELEKAAAYLSDPPLRLTLGKAYIGSGNTEKGMAILIQALEEHPTASNQIEAAGWLAAHKASLELAQQYAESAVRSIERELSEMPDNVSKAALSRTLDLVSYWDTLGWVHFQRGNLEPAERYVHAAWVLGQGWGAGYHLGQIYEKLGRKAEAIRAFAAVLATNFSFWDARTRLVALAGDEEKIEPLLQAARAELVAMRTTRISKLPVGKAQADFYFVLTPGRGVSSVSFIAGDPSLHDCTAALKAASLPGIFPGSATTKLFRRGTVTCLESGECSIELFIAAAAKQADANPAHANIRGAARADSGPPFQVAGGLTSPVRIHEVKPEYTEEAKEARLEGTVELEMEVDTIGRPRNIKVVKGLGKGLDEEAVKAVQQWRFIPGWKDNQAVAASVCVKANFKLPNAADA